MAIQYILETLLVMGFFLSVLLVGKWLEDFKARYPNFSVKNIMKTRSQSLVLPSREESEKGAVVYLKVSNSKIKKRERRIQEERIRKAANSE